KMREHSDPKIAALPVIALTGNVAKEDMERYLANGMDAILAKPIDPEKLRAVISDIANKSLERKINAPAPQRQQATVKHPQHHIFNSSMLQTLKDTIGADQLNELLDELLEKASEIVGEMDNAIKAGNMAS